MKFYRVVLLSALLAIVSSLSAQDCQDISLYDPDANCPAVFDPVCGCDGVTYANSCEAQAYGGLTAWTAGTCMESCVDPDSIDLNVTCPAIFDPVCGCNGITYNNECVARFTNGVLVTIDGPCSQPCIDSSLIDLQVSCPWVFEPVCGCDSITYSNACFATNYHGVPVFSDGPCPLTYCKDYSLIDSNAVCPTVVEPVCGCDDITYQNACVAEQYNGVQQYTNGPCTVGLPLPVPEDYISAYPVPTNGYLQVVIQESDIFEAELKLVNISGAVMLNTTTNQVRNELDISHLPNGIYFMQVRMAGKFNKTIKVLKR